MRWVKNPKWTLKADILYWLYFYPREYLRTLHAIAEGDHILNGLDWREELGMAAALADMKAGRWYTWEKEKNEMP